MSRSAWGILLLSLPSALSFHLVAATRDALQARPRVSVNSIVAKIKSDSTQDYLTAEMAETMLGLIDQWAMDDFVSKPFTEDQVSDACMVPIELEWLNAKICQLEECPLDLPEAFQSIWERVVFRSEGCVTANALKDEIRTMA